MHLSNDISSADELTRIDAMSARTGVCAVMNLTFAEVISETHCNIARLSGMALPRRPMHCRSFADR